MQLYFGDYRIKPMMRISTNGLEEVKDCYGIEAKNNNDSYFVIAEIEYDKKERGWDFKSIGTRYLKYRSDGLEEFILACIEVLDVIKRYELEEVVDDEQLCKNLFSEEV